MPGTNAREPLCDTVAIVGVGLIGGSLGMATRKKGLARRVVGVGRSEQKLMRAKILGAIDEYSLDLEHGAEEADLVILCTPVRTVIPTLRQVASHLKNDAVVTDVGSTKKEIVEEATRVMPEGACFVGGHPMAGSEQAGVERATASLFEGATYVVTSSDDTNLAALGVVTSFAEGVGARVEVMTPAEHDAAVAVISHLPHAISASLLLVAEHAQRTTAKTFRLAAGSFRDLTRISDSPPELWRDICSTNTAPLIASIQDLRQKLDEFAAVLETHDESAIEDFFEQARQIRDAYLRLTK